MSHPTLPWAAARGHGIWERLGEQPLAQPQPGRRGGEDHLDASSAREGEGVPQPPAPCGVCSPGRLTKASGPGPALGWRGGPGSRALPHPCWPIRCAAHSSWAGAFFSIPILEASTRGSSERPQASGALTRDDWGSISPVPPHWHHRGPPQGNGVPLPGWSRPGHPPVGPCTPDLPPLADSP